MLSVKRELRVVGVFFILLFSLTTCREISILKTDHDGKSTIKHRTSLKDYQKFLVEHSRGLEETINNSHSKNITINIVRRDTDYETRDEADFVENRINLTDDRTKSLSPNKKGKTHKKTSRSEKKVQVKTLQKLNQENSNSLLSDNLQTRNVRSVNTTDYYAQRKAVMDKFYMRQREITAKYSKDRNNTDVLKNRNTRFWLKKDISYVTDPPNNNNRILKMSNEVNTTTLNTDVRKPAVEDITAYSPPTTRNYTNTSLSGPLPRKSRQDDEENDEDESEETIDENSISTSSRPNQQNMGDSSVDQRWGSCSGTLVYQHNLFLNLKGPSNLDTIFEVIMEGPICITCVEVIRYNRTRARVSLDSGGRGYEYVKLRLKGYENEGFSYIVKIWGVRKTGDDCSRQL